ncbi:MAG: hypothetical protein ACUVQP_01010 [Bacteroidales bacterium]
MEKGAIMADKFRCILWLGEVEVRRDIKNNPFWHCPDCDVQFFVRKDPGEERLTKLLKYFEEGKTISFSKTSNPF